MHKDVELLNQLLGLERTNPWWGKSDRAPFNLLLVLDKITSTVLDEAHIWKVSVVGNRPILTLYKGINPTETAVPAGKAMVNGYELPMDSHPKLYSMYRALLDEVRLFNIPVQEIYWYPGRKSTIKFKAHPMTGYVLLVE